MRPSPTIDPTLARGAEVLVRDQMAVKPGESVLITSDTAGDLIAVEAVLNAASLAGARGSVMFNRPLPFQGLLADPYVAAPLAEAVKNCDVWIDMTCPYLAGSDTHDAAMKNKRTRYLLAVDIASGGLRRIYAGVDMDALYAVQQELDSFVAKATGKECRITNQAGSDVSFTLAKSSYGKRRHADVPGTNSVPGSCLMYPELDSVRGRVVLDTVFHEYYMPLREPLTIELDGRIQSVSGGGSERPVMERALRRAAGGDFGYIIHFTLGFHPAARQGQGFVEDLRVTGNNAVGFGLPWWEPGGGENHPDGLMSLQTLTINRQLICQDGIVVGPPQAKKLAAKLKPLVH